MLTPRFTGRVAISQQKDLGWSVCTLTTITLSSIYADPHLGNILTVTFVGGHRLITSHGKATLIWCISNTWEYRRLSPNRTHSPLECTVTILSLTVSYINSAFRFIQIYVPGNEGNSVIGEWSPLSLISIVSPLLSGRLNLLPPPLVAEAARLAVKPS